MSWVAYATNQVCIFKSCQYIPGNESGKSNNLVRKVFTYPLTHPSHSLLSILFVSIVKQYYHHCSNVRIKGKEGGRLPELDMTIVDVKQLGQKMNVHAEGDKKRGKSSGPDARERRQNTNGFYAYGGGAGKKGINLGLIRS